MATTTDAATEFLDGLVGAEAKATADAEAAVNAFARTVAQGKPVDQGKLTTALRATGRTVAAFAEIVGRIKKRLDGAAALKELPRLEAEYTKLLEDREATKAKRIAIEEEWATEDRAESRRQSALADRLAAIQATKTELIRTCPDEKLVALREATEDQYSALAAEKKRIEEQILRDRPCAENLPAHGTMYKPEDVELAKSRTEVNKARLLEIRIEHDRVEPALEALDLQMALAAE